ncbi:hypothetical protein V5O48_015179 [Marasmius crinis-equi]|uniref:F-box domain-containing protein n=1 Tax=Marasmius crinis-equi TaxID=585013 RepID=A0ABR3EV82_9AGAR
MITIISLPNELLDEIACNVASEFGLPSSLTPLLLTCKRIHNVLTGPGGKAVWRRIFQGTFSSSAAVRRLGARLRNEDWLFQLQLYVRVLRDVQGRRMEGEGGMFEEQDVERHSVEELMWVLWVMCLEDDGRNRVQMDKVGVYEWVAMFVRTRLARDEAGWPVDNALNSCALHVFWYLTTKHRLFAECPTTREQTVRAVLPYVTMPFRYPPSSVPPHQRTWNQIFYNRRLPMFIPLVTDAAKLIYAARRELFKVRIPSGLGFARTRRERDAAMLGRKVVVPTLEDFEESNDCFLGGEAKYPSGAQSDKDAEVDWKRTTSRRTAKGGGTALTSLPKVVYRTSSSSPTSSSSSPSDVDPCLYDPTRIHDIISIDESDSASRDWDTDWWRLMCSFHGEDEDEDVDMESDDDNDNDNVAHKPGEMTGLWVGKLFVPSDSHFASLFHATHSTTNPMHIPQDFSENTLGSVASMPVWMRLKEDPTQGEEEIDLTGSTDPHHGDAWHHFRFKGKVRRWDGFVEIVRTAFDPYGSETGKRHDKIVLYGTLVGGGKNFVGNWRALPPASESEAEERERRGRWPWEGAFSLGRRVEA